MPTTTPKTNEFILLENGLRHDPTGTAYIARGPAEPWTSIQMGNFVLPDGRHYRESEVEAMAREIWSRHLSNLRDS